MLPVYYRRFATLAGFGVIGREARKRYGEHYTQSVNESYEQDICTAIHLEIASYEDCMSGIDIMSDARHGWRKNAKDTSVVVIGDKTHKVLRCEHITKCDDPVSQRHETLGTKRMYDFFDQESIPIRIHVHDRNLTINKMVKDRGDTITQNDVWHAIKSSKKNLCAIASGPKYK